MSHFKNAHWEFAIQWHTGREWVRLKTVHTSASKATRAFEEAQESFKGQAKVRLVRRLVEEWQEVG